MSEYIYDVVNQTSKLDWAFAFQRTGAFPLDRSSLFSSYEDAVAYAKGDKTDSRKLGGSSYIGQTVSVYDEINKIVSLYIIETDRSLKEVGSTPIGDNASIEIVDGQVQLKNFGIGYYAYTATVKNESGEIVEPSKYVYTEGFKEGLEPRVVKNEEKFEIAWYEPSGETIEDISAHLETANKAINSLNDEIDEIKELIGEKASENTEATGIYKELSAKADKNSVYTKTETDSAISKAIADTEHLKRTKVNSIDDIDTSKEDADQYIYMVPTGLTADDDKYDEYMIIDGFIEKVGSWEVDLKDYAKTKDVNDALDKKVDIVEGSRLMTEEEGQKLSNISEGAEKNYISSVSEELIVEQGKLSINEIAQSKVNGLINKLSEITVALENKVDEDENARLITLDEIEKLSSIKDLIQSVDTDKFTIDENGKLLLDSVEIEEIVGLAEALSNKVDKVDGSRLITQAEADKLEALVLEDGEITVSGSVNASNVKELYDVVNRIVTGTGTALFDNVERTLLGIQPGAEKNIINSVNNSQFNIENRNLSINSIEISIVNGLEAVLNNKANNSSVTNLESLLNSQYQAHEARIANLEGRLTWSPLVDQNN